MTSSKLLLSLALLIPASALHARQLTPAQALDRAFSESGVAPSRASSADYSLSYTAKAPGSTTPGVYVFTRPGGGFIMVSADDAAESLLGYSDTSTFSPEAISPSMAYWMESYASQVEWAAAHPSTPSRAAATRPSRAPIAPLLTTTWNQNSPYNDLAPEVSGSSQSNGRAPTGCVATSTSQVMNYHKWPAKGTGSNSYEWTLGGTKQTISMDFSTVTFDWNDMLNSYAGSYTEAQGNAVATLMKAVGVAVKMQYGPNDSGATSEAAWEALYTYFGYSKSATFSQRGWYGLYDWEDLIYISLKNDGPAILGGQSGTGGHSFVCDGYSTDGFFHINWGWGGTSNGYFLLTALNPSSQGIGGSEGGYNFNQDVITGIRPAKDGDQPNCQLVAVDFNPTSSAAARQITLSDMTVYTYSTVNLTNVTFGLEIGGNFYYSNSKFSGQFGAPGTGYKFSYSVPLTGLPAGSYQARPAFKCDQVPDGSVILTDVTELPFFNLTVASDGTITTEVPSPEITIDNFTFSTSFLQGQQFSFSAEVTNSGVTEYSGALTAVII
ncbi:MAG: C10 family peptidase, partial [Duncaniella sp.]|nr:C10 family peptidase [Duncaniella sp.]